MRGKGGGPVMAEVVNQVAFQVIGNDNTVCLASEAGQFELHVIEPVLGSNLIQSSRIMTNALRVFRTYLVEGVTANAERMKAYVDGSVGVTTAINPHVGYEAGTRLIVRDKVLMKEQLDAILDPLETTSPGIAGARPARQEHVWKEQEQEDDHDRKP